jgi:imidazolonepropionase-like amidohydrolase
MSGTKTLVLVLVAFAGILTARAEEGAANGTTYVKAGRLIDVAASRARMNQAILIEGDKIVRVGNAADMPVPAGARVIDLSASTVLPGLIDMHDHLTGDSRFHGYRSLAISAPREALYGAYNARKTLLAGFTSVRNVGASHYTDVALRDAINDGELPGPRLRVSGPALGITGGHCDNNLLPAEYHDRSEGVADGPWAIRAKVRENIKYGVDLIKFCATGGVLSKGDSVGGQQYTFEEMKALVDEAHQHGRKVASHAHGTEGIKAAILAGVDSVEHASLIDDEGLKLAKQRGTYLVMDIYNDTFIMEHGAAMGMLPESLAKEKMIGQLQRDNFRKAVEAGVNLAFGTDGGVYPHGDNGKQFAVMVEYGMTPMQAIRAATVNAADLIGWPDAVGRIATGYYADIIATDGNPLDDVTQLEDVDFVMKGGTVYKQ